MESDVAVQYTTFVDSGKPLAGTRSIEVMRFAAVALQVGLLFAVAYLYRIEEIRGFLNLLPLVFGGFVLHAWLPLRLRMPFFLLLSFGAIYTLLGLTNGAILVGIGLALVAVCHLPVPMRARVALVLAFGGALAAVRLEWIETSRGSLIIPTLASMFMFRLIIYLYEIRFERQPVPLAHRLSYFFLLPNVCFPMFPLVDYATYKRTYYDRPAHVIYQKGAYWIFRGLTHLLCYRIVYYHVIPGQADVSDLGTLALFATSSYLLYLRVSGQFHLIVGLLCLFGFNLPETHARYLFATGFNDYWRRINIYWKDFMMKVFFYPSFVKLKRFGTMSAMVGATLVVFLVTWLLHSYQLFWLRGTFPLTAVDFVFWFAFGVLVVVNSVWEARRGRRGSLTRKPKSIGRSAGLAVQTTMMFVVMCALWSLWSSGSIAEWVSLVRAGISGGWSPLASVILLLLVGGTVIGAIGLYARERISWPTRKEPAIPRSATWMTTTAVLFVLVSLSPVQARLGEPAAAMVASLRQDGFNQRDAALFERGYYESLLGSDRMTSRLGEARAKRPRDWVPLEESDVARPTDDMRRYELVENEQIVFKRRRLSTNRWGMRDQDYALKRPEGTYRIAFIGSSQLMGEGVDDHETFESIVEARLNERYGRRDAAPHQRYEILNFGVSGYGALEQTIILDKVIGFEPSALFYVAHADEVGRLVQRLLTALDHGRTVPPRIADVVTAVGIEPGMTRGEMERRISPRGNELTEWAYRTIAAACAKQGIMPVWVLSPIFVYPTDPLEPSRLARFAEEMGFIALRLDEMFVGQDDRQLIVAPWDFHPNARAHRMIGDRLYQWILDNEASIRVGLASGGPTPNHGTR